MTSTLVEFRAGRMTVSGTTVKPDKRKGMVMLQQVRVGCWTVYAKVRSDRLPWNLQSEDALIHFCWKDRTSGVVEEVRPLALAILSVRPLLRISG